MEEKERKKKEEQDKKKQMDLIEEQRIGKQLQEEKLAKEQFNSKRNKLFLESE